MSNDFTRQQLSELFGLGYTPDNLFDERYPDITLKDKCAESIRSVKGFREYLIHLVSQGADMDKFSTLVLQKREKNYVHIMNMLCTFTGLNHFGTNSAEKIERLCKASDALVRDLEELAKTEQIDFGNRRNEHILKEYLRISESIRKSEDIKILEEKMMELSTASASKPYSPFVFVCASSGSGKTNMAFSLNTPSLYFVSGECGQRIYQCFYRASDNLHDLLEEDLKRHKKSVAVDNVHRSNTSYKVVGYLVELIIAVDTMYHSATPRTNAAELQYSIRQIEFKPMTLAEGRLALEQHFKTKNYFFPIVYDESNTSSFNSSKMANDFVLRKFIFAGNIMRCLKCVPIFMYVNVQAARYLEYSMGRADDGECSFLLWHRPPGVSKAEMSQRFAAMTSMISKWKGEKQYPSEKLIKFLEKYLLLERPLFLEYAEIFIKMFCAKEASSCDSDEEFLAWLLEYVLEYFNDRKSNFPLLNCGQLAYMTVSTQNAIEGELGGEDCYESDSYIEGHFGYLAATPDDPQFPSYTSISRNSEGNLFYSKDAQKFQICAHFKPFHEAPLTGLIVTGISADNQRILCASMDWKEQREWSKKMKNDPRRPERLNSSLKRISIVSAIDKTLEVKCTREQYSKTPLGFKLELTLFASAILASRGGGFKGCPFQLFLEMLVREFDFKGDYADGLPPPAIKFHKDFPESIMMKQIPFLASMAVESWDKMLAEELRELFGANLGIAHASVQESCGDLVVVDSADRSVILVGECKMQAAPVNVGCLKKSIIDKFANYPECDLCLFVAPRFANLQTYHDSETVLWVFERTKDELHLVPAQTSKSQNVNASKNAIIIDIWTVFGLEAEKKLKEIIATYH